MLFRRPAVFLSALFLALAGLGGVLVAQMESGERGILPVDSSGTLEITGIKVDVGGKDADSARYAGWRIAQREGFKALWAKMNKRPVSQAPNLSDSTLDGLVSSIVVEQEQIGPNRYIATLGVLFDRARAGELLGVAGEVRRSAPMLLIPVMIAGGTATSVELRNPWQRAWAQFRTSNSPIDYVRVSGLGVDPLLVNAAQTRRPGRGWWRNILDLYGAANILVAEVRVDRLYPGGPSKAQFVGRFGPDGQVLGSFELVARNSNDLPRMLSEGVQRMDELFVQAHSAGIVRGDPDLIIQPPPPTEELIEEEIEAPVVVPPTVVQVLVIERGDVNAVAQSVAQIRSLAGVIWVTQAPLPNGNANLSVNYRGDATALGLALSSRGWAVTNRGGVLYVTRGAAPAIAAQSAACPAIAVRAGVDQIALPLDWPQARDESRLILSDANRAAFDHFRGWSMWPVKASMLTGPRRSGRSLLARAFVGRVGGRLFENAERHDEEELFHAWNAAQDSGKPLVMIVDEVPPAWQVKLPDLRTRLAITPIARIEQPDDALFKAIIQLLFADRGVHIPDDALKYIGDRVERSYWMAERVVEAIDRFAIAERSRLTLPTIRRALGEGGILDARGAA